MREKGSAKKYSFESRLIKICFVCSTSEACTRLSFIITAAFIARSVFTRRVCRYYENFRPSHRAREATTNLPEVLKHADELIVYDNTAHRSGFRVVAQFIGGNLCKAALSMPDWVAEVFARIACGKATRNVWPRTLSPYHSLYELSHGLFRNTSAVGYRRFVQRGFRLHLLRLTRLPSQQRQCPNLLCDDSRCRRVSRIVSAASHWRDTHDHVRRLGARY
jgi:hypothetical protein